MGEFFDEILKRDREIVEARKKELRRKNELRDFQATWGFKPEEEQTRSASKEGCDLRCECRYCSLCRRDL